MLYLKSVLLQRISSWTEQHLMQLYFFFNEDCKWYSKSFFEMLPALSFSRAWWLPHVSSTPVFFSFVRCDDSVQAGEETDLYPLNLTTRLLCENMIKYLANTGTKNPINFILSFGLFPLWLWRVSETLLIDSHYYLFLSIGCRFRVVWC